MNKMTLPRVIAVISALACVILMFLPYISMTGEHWAEIRKGTYDEVLSDSGIKASDMADLSLFKYAKFFFDMSGDGNSSHTNAGYIFSGALMFAIGGFAVLTFLFALGKKAVPTLIFDILMAVAFYLVNKDISLRGVMPDSDKVWGIAHALYYPLAAIIAVSAIWLFIVKHRLKRDSRT